VILENTTQEATSRIRGWGGTIKESTKRGGPMVRRATKKGNREGPKAGKYTRGSHKRNWHEGGSLKATKEGKKGEKGSGQQLPAGGGRKKTGKTWRYKTGKNFNSPGERQPENFVSKTSEGNLRPSSRTNKQLAKENQVECRKRQGTHQLRTKKKEWNDLVSNTQKKKRGLLPGETKIGHEGVCKKTKKRRGHRFMLVSSREKK